MLHQQVIHWMLLLFCCASSHNIHFSIKPSTKTIPEHYLPIDKLFDEICRQPFHSLDDRIKSSITMSIPGKQCQENGKQYHISPKCPIFEEFRSQTFVNSIRIHSVQKRIGNDSIVRFPVLSPTKLIIELILKVIIVVIQIKEVDIVLKPPRCRFASTSSRIHLSFRSSGCTD
mmetsp:Transcript_18676/g.38790  ORF Transcript_18676/g.38790 Transcript_18676/m.38790 type:complete len:173 (+) Transcript_18676:28-546(+)